MQTNARRYSSSSDDEEGVPGGTYEQDFAWLPHEMDMPFDLTLDDDEEDEEDEDVHDDGQAAPTSTSTEPSQNVKVKQKIEGIMAQISGNAGM